jgi:hypothetical protein
MFEYMFDRISQHLPTDKRQADHVQQAHPLQNQLTSLQTRNRYLELAVNSLPRAARVWFIARLLCAGKPAHSAFSVLEPLAFSAACAWERDHHQRERDILDRLSPKTSRSADLPTCRRWVRLSKHVVAQCDSCDCTGAIARIRRGIEAVLTSALLQDHHQPLADHRQRPRHLVLREARIQIELAPGRLILHESRHKVDRRFESCDAGDPPHRPFHRRVETPSFMRSQRIDQVLFGHEVAIDGRP